MLFARSQALPGNAYNTGALLRKTGVFNWKCYGLRPNLAKYAYAEIPACAGMTRLRDHRFDCPIIRAKPDYRRQCIMRELIQALEKAGRRREVIPLLEREAPITNCYDELVDRLISVRRKKEAESWARKGFEKTVGKLDGIAWSLEKKLKTMAEQEKDWPMVASYSAIEFFDQPIISHYTALEKDSKAAKVWPEVRADILHYLETGQRPDQIQDRASSRSGRGGIGGKQVKSRKGVKTATGFSSPPAQWPLPPTGLRLATERKQWQKFPDTGTLIDVAIKEKRNEDVLKWYEKVEKSRGFWRGGDSDKIAQAVQKSHPDVALQLWKRLVESNIAQVKPSAYQEAGQYLRKMEKVYRREKKLNQWRDYLEQLRSENKRRPRMIDVLNDLEGKRRRILDT